METDRKDIADLKALGVSATRNKDMYKFDKPDPSKLECFKNKYKGNDAVITFYTSENLKSLCPLTQQPDDCRNLWIQYVPLEKMVESKSLKLYLNGFRMFGCFHEEICHIIANDLWELMSPRWLRVVVEYEPRGGLAIIPCVVKSLPGYVPCQDIVPPISFNRTYH